ISSGGTRSRATSAPSIMSSLKYSGGSSASARRRPGSTSALFRKYWRRSSALGEVALMIMPRDSWIVPTPALVVQLSSPLRWLLRRNSSRSGRQNSSRSPVNTGPLPTDLTWTGKLVGEVGRIVVGVGERPDTMGGVGGLLRDGAAPPNGRGGAPLATGGRVGDAGRGRKLAIGSALSGMLVGVGRSLAVSAASARASSSWLFTVRTRLTVGPSGSPAAGGAQLSVRSLVSSSPIGRLGSSSIAST